MHKIKPVYVLILLSLPLYLGLGSVHLLDWDEINFAECAREMIVSGNYIVPQIQFEAFWEKPPLFFWLQVLSMKIFGINEFAARFPNALFGTLTAILLFFTGKKLNSSSFGFTWALLHLGSLLPFMYFKSGIIDPVFNFFIFSSYSIFIISLQKKSTGYLPIMIAGVLNGLAILTKGPVGFLIPFLSILIGGMLYKKKFFRQLFMFSISAAGVASLWFVSWILTNGWDTFLDFIKYQSALFSSPVAGHRGFFLYHFVVVFFGCFPVSIFALPILFNWKKNQSGFYTSSMKILFWVVMVLFTIVSTKIIHYSSLAYFPLSFFAATYLIEKFHLHQKKKIFSRAYLILGAFWALCILSVISFPFYKEKILPYIHDVFAVSNMQASTWQFTLLSFSAFLVFMAGTGLGFYLLTKEKISGFVITQSITISITFCILQFSILPKIEEITQGGLITEIQRLRQEGIPVVISGMKSYAPYFYGNIDESYNTVSPQNTRPVCIVTRINKPRPAMISPAVEPYSKGGFVYYLLR
ncbi:MAG: ArnT family glycosyltransferase [Chitinophagales bacterium]